MRSGPVSSPCCSYTAYPPAVCLQLTKDYHEDVRALANKADRYAASIHHHQQLLPVFAATADDCEASEE